MNKYKFKIIPENNNFVGYALLNDEVVYTTKLYKDATTASRDLAQYASKQQNNSNLKAVSSSFTINKNKEPAVVQTINPNITPSVRRCCGRG